MKFKPYKGNDGVKVLNIKDQDGSVLCLESFKDMELGWPLIAYTEGGAVGLSRKKAVKLAKAILAELGE